MIKKLLISFAAMIMAISCLTSCSQQETPELLDFANYTPHFNEEYAVLEKSPDEDFIILNLSDTQLNDDEVAEGTVQREVLEYTIDELIKKTNPDLITISGDLAWARQFASYKHLCDLIESYGIPWAPVWGNHDNENMDEYWAPHGEYEYITDLNYLLDDNLMTGLDDLENLVSTYENCLFQKGAEEMGSGNYVISIEENGTPITGIFMMDAHIKDTYTDANGNEFKEDGSLNEEQKIWYEYRIRSMKELGYKDSILILHQPIHAYKIAFNEAFNFEYSPNAVPWQESADDKYWTEGYEDSFGVNHDGVYGDVDDGVLELLKEYDHTKYVVVGHNHMNNFVINYQGITLAYALKTGMGCYWEQNLSGGTVIRISSNGIEELYHEYIDVSHIIEAHQ